MRLVLPTFLICGYLLSPTAVHAQALMEPLGRGVVVVRSGETSAHVGWRMLGTDPADIGFNLITRAGKKGSEMRFTLTPSTHRRGSVAVGTPVSVRYRKDGKTDVATAITAHQVKQQAAHAASPKR